MKAPVEIVLLVLAGNIGVLPGMSFSRCVPSAMHYIPTSDGVLYFLLPEP